MHVPLVKGGQGRSAGSLVSSARFIMLLCVVCVVCVALMCYHMMYSCDVEGCSALYDHRVQFKEGIRCLCHEHYVFMVLK